jgi:hypothetical protein
VNKTKQIADRFREVLLNGTWVANTNFKDQLADVSFQEATTVVESLNTIALLSFHINYYIAGIQNVFDGGTLDIRDKYSFDLPALQSEQDWINLKIKLFNDAEIFANSIEKLSDDKLQLDFVDAKYGTYQRNLDGMIEHCYYHLGQVVLLKKILKLRAH